MRANKRYRAFCRAPKQCAAKNRKPTLQDVPEHLLADNNFLNKLKTGLQAWVKEMERVVALVNREPGTSSASAVINFWSEFERALVSIEDLLKTDGVRTWTSPFLR